MEEYNYSKFIKRIVEKLNENNNGSQYYLTELFNWYDTIFAEGGEVPCAGRRIFGVILNENPVSDLTYRNIKEFTFSRKDSAVEEAKKYLLDNNIVYCYYVDDENTDILMMSYNRLYRYFHSRLHVNRKLNISIDEAKKHFYCINEDLLNSVIDDINQEESQSLVRKLR